MKKILKCFFLSLILFILMPLCTFALSYESEFYENTQAVKDFEMGKMYVKNMSVTNYFSYANTSSRALYISGKVSNDYGRDAEFEVIIKTYDKNKNVLGEVIQKYVVAPGSDIVVGVPIIARDVNYDYNLIKYYTVKFDVLTDVEREDKIVNDDYYFDDYYVDVDVSLDNVYTVKESINVTYRNYVIPVVKKIPIRYKYYSNLKSVNRRAIISDIVSNSYYTLDLKEGARVVNIGKDNRDEKVGSYTLEYKYNVGKDTLKNNDEVVYFFNNTYDAKFDKLSYSINLPKEVNDIEVVFVDQYGHDLGDYEYKVEGTMIYGSFSDVIEPSSVIGIKIVLPDYYFENATTNVSAISVLSIVMPILITALSVLIWFMWGNIKNKYTKNLYPYKALNSVEIGYLYNGKVLENDIATLIIYLANKGYVEIVKVNKKYKIVKVKDYKSDNQIEKIFLDNLFKDKVEITIKDFEKSLYKITKLIKNEQDTDKNKEELFVNNIFNYKIIFCLMIAIIFVIITINLIIEYNPNVLLINLIVSGVGYGLLLKSVLGKNKKIEKMIIASIAFVMIFASIALSCFKAFSMSSLVTITYTLGVICMSSIGFIAKAMPDRTRFGVKALGSINGYKNNLLTCDIELIKNELNHNKNYFSDILPYSIVLGISDKWFNRFKELNCSKPDWYDCEEDSFEDFYNTMKEIYSDVYIALKNRSK